MIERIAESHKILMINSSRGFIGGVEKLMVQMAKSLKNENWQVYGLFEKTVRKDAGFDTAFDDFEVLGSDAIEDLVEDYLEMGIEVILIHKCSRVAWLKALTKHFPTAVLVHDHDYYCPRRHKYFPFRRINCHLPLNAGYCSVCSGFIEKRDKGFGFIDIASKVALLDAVRGADLSLVLSDYMRRNLLMNGFRKAAIHLMVPYQEVYEVQKAIPQKPARLLYVGQLIRGKGVDLLLQAFAKVKAPCILKILGRGNDDIFLQNLAKELGIEKRLEFCGWTDDVASEYAASDVVIVPSRWQEPFGLVGIEAFAHAKAVIAFNVGGISQWLKHRVNGILVKEKDVVKLAKAIDKLLADPALAQSYGQAGRQMVQSQYSYEKYLASFVEPLLALAKKAKTGDRQ